MSSGNEDPVPSDAPAFYDWDGERWYFNKRMGYHLTRAGSLLHRCLWIKHHGPIEDGYEINHINRQRWDNRLENLELLTISEHRRLGALQRTDSSWKDNQTPEAVSKRLSAYWQRREPRDVICVQCGQGYKSTGMRAKYCSRKCRSDAGRDANNRARALRREGKRSN